MTEPNRDVGRLPHVQRPDTLPAATLDVVSDRAPAFHGFYVGYRDRIGRALAVTLGDADLAADAVDEAMARAYQRWSSVAVMANPAGWVYRVGLNVATSRLRRVQRHAALGRRASAELPSEVEVRDPAVVRALGELSVDHRAVVVCRLLLGWSEADTAAALSLRPGTVKSRLHRALAALEPKLSHLRPEVS